MNRIIEGLKEANNHLTGSKEHHDAISEAIACFEQLELQAARGREISRAFLPVMQAARPLVLNLERLIDAQE